MRHLFLLGGVLLTLFSCKNSPIPVCDNNEGSEVNWVHEQVETLTTLDDSYSYIIQVEYKSELVYSVQGCNPAASYILAYYRCNGELIEGPYDDSDFENATVIWRPDDSPCNFDDIQGK